MTHLTPDELIDAMEGSLVAGRQTHLATCEECRRHLDDLTGALSDAKRAGVPEPSPLFWQHFSQRVRIAIDQEPPVSALWPEWLRWQVLLPLGVTAMLILGLMMTLPIDNAPPATEHMTDTTPLEPVGESWTAVEELVGQMDIETASAAGVIEPGVADLAVLELTADEQQELTRLLQSELTRAKS
jgi:hypothetical protein